jgi:hypothetical protein
LLPSEATSDASVLAKDGSPSIANFKPQPAWRAIRQWLEAMQLFQPHEQLNHGGPCDRANQQTFAGVRDDFRDSDSFSEFP